MGSGATPHRGVGRSLTDKRKWPKYPISPMDSLTFLSTNMSHQVCSMDTQYVPQATFSSPLLLAAVLPMLPDACAFHTLERWPLLLPPPPQRLQAQRQSYSPAACALALFEVQALTQPPPVTPAPSAAALRPDDKSKHSSPQASRTELVLDAWSVWRAALERKRECRMLSQGGFLFPSQLVSCCMCATC